MIAAIYARKSTEQSGVADEQKSVVRQIDHARAYAVAKGWTVGDEHVYVDDGISGAEFATRPGFVRLMNALRPRPSFQVLVMSEVSRLGREQIETAYALKQLSVAGVRCFSYLEDRELLMASATDKFLLGAVTFAADLEREKARQRTYDALVRKARAGYVTGGRVFGYDNVEITDATGKRSHVERQINDREAAIVRQIFDLCAKDYGVRGIAKHLNEQAAPAPRAEPGRRPTWAPSTIHAVLARDLYRGVIVWNQTRKRDTWGKKQTSNRPRDQWLTVDAPHLRIVTDDLWHAAQARRADARATYARSERTGRLCGRPPMGGEAKYLLTGYARCNVCGGSICVKSRSHGQRRALFYGCTTFHLRGRAVCPNNTELPMAAVEDALLDTIERDVLNPAVFERAVARAVAILSAPDHDPTVQRDRITTDLAAIERELSALTAAIVAGGEAATLVEAIRDREARRDALRGSLAGIERLMTRTPADVEREIRERLADWRAMLRRNVPQGRQVLRKLLTTPLRFDPVGDRGWAFTGQAALGKMLTGFVDAKSVASLTAHTLIGLSCRLAA
jgi:site-specific DNA recombinase